MPKPKPGDEPGLPVVPALMRLGLGLKLLNFKFLILNPPRRGGRGVWLKNFESLILNLESRRGYGTARI